MDKARHGVEDEASPLLLGRHEKLVREFQQVNFYLLVFEHFVDEIEQALLRGMHNVATFGALIQKGPEWALGHGRHEHAGGQQWQDRLALEREAAISLCITCREARDRGTGFVEIGVTNERCLIIEDCREDAFGMEIAQAEFRLESELVIEDQRIGLNDDMGRRVPIMAKAWSDAFHRYDPTAEPIVLLEHQYLLPGFGEIGGGDQAIMARADKNNVVGSGH